MINFKHLKQLNTIWSSSFIISGDWTCLLFTEAVLKISFAFPRFSMMTVQPSFFMFWPHNWMIFSIDRSARYFSLTLERSMDWIMVVIGCSMVDCQLLLAQRTWSPTSLNNGLSSNLFAESSWPGDFLLSLSVSDTDIWLAFPGCSTNPSGFGDINSIG